MINWEQLPNYGDLMTEKDFTKAVKDGFLIDYDGYGKYSDGKRISNIKVHPSEIKKYGFDKRFSHVVWFNR